MQDMYVYPTQTLMCHMEGRKGNLYNGAFYTVQSIDIEEPFQIHLQSPDQSIINLSREDVSKYMRLTHAITYASFEGLTLNGRIRLCDVRHLKFTWRKLFVALSRATSSKLVEVDARPIVTH